MLFKSKPRKWGQTDLLAILGLDRNLAVAAVEGKVDESFGPLLSGRST
jgi:hypothetical protein